MVRPKPITQKNALGCGAACVAGILDCEYKKALGLFSKGIFRSSTYGFNCKDIVEVLDKAGRDYSYCYVNKKTHWKIYRKKTIVFIKRSAKYPHGHYLCRLNGKWMDPWINFQACKDIKKAKSGFRKRLPGKPIYMIYN